MQIDILIVETRYNGNKTVFMTVHTLSWKHVNFITHEWHNLLKILCIIPAKLLMISDTLMREYLIS